MRVVSLFDGIACGREALKRAGIPVTEYVAFEIDKHAIQIAKKNHPDIIHVGSVVGFPFKMLNGFDMVIGGSPCQSFSFSGKGLAFQDPRGQLFFEFVRAIKEIQPKYFLLENVKMKKEHEAVITQFMGVEPVQINSALVSAQNRRRLYWCNWSVEQPEDRGILLKDIIEDGVTDRDKSYCIDANYWKGGNLEQYFEKSRRQLVFNERKANCLRARCNNEVLNEKGVERVLGKTIGNMVFGAAQRGRYIVDGKRQDHKMKTAGLTEQRIELGGEKSNTLTSVQKDSLVLEGMTIRKLTPIECERLQTLEDNYTFGISNTQRYKALGNGWTVEVIVHLLNQLKISIDNKV